MTLHRRSDVSPPVHLHRVNGYDATLAAIRAALDVRDGQWVSGAPSHIFPEFLAALEKRGFYLGVEDHNASRV